MLRLLAVGLLCSGTLAMAQERPAELKLKAPAGWGGETIRLPPEFAPEMKLQGLEHIRFAPGMMQADSDSFFSYAFVFELRPEPELTATVVQQEFLKYYRGLCTAVLRGELPDVDPKTFTLELQRVEAEAPSDTEAPAAANAVTYTGTLSWVEPFATKKPQKLHLEIRTWTAQGGNFVFACVSPQPRTAAIWKQLHSIRDGYLRQK